MEPVAPTPLRGDPAVGVRVVSGLQPGQVLGDRFEVVGELGRGGSATVWLAHDRVRDARVALKVLHPHLADGPVVEARLRREVAAAARVRHEGALVAHDVHEADGRLLLVLPFHPGRSLADAVAADGPFTAEALVALARRLAGALSAAHRAGVVHRDVTPGNVLVDADGTAVLTDFGLARVDGRHTATATAALGTPGYAAPEVYEGRRTDPRSDLYGLGAVLYFAATGTAPFDAPTPMAALRRQLEGEHTPLGEARPDLPEGLTRTVDAMLRPDADARPASAAEVLRMVAGDAAPPVARRTAPARPRARHHLPPGDHRVDLKWRAETWHRLQARKDRRRDQPFLAALEDTFESTWRTLMDRPRGEEPPPPERHVAAAVSHAAGLPANALRPAAALLEYKSRLVDGVDQETAEFLAAEARAAGFRASVETSEGSRTALVQRLTGLGIAFGVTTVLVAAGPMASAPFVPLILLFVIMGTLAQAEFAPDLRKSDRPLAYGRDLRPHLSPAHRDALPPPRLDREPDPTPEPAHRQRAPVAPSSEPAVPEGPPPPAGPVLARIARLSAALDADQELPSAARRDLARATDDLAAQARRLAERLGEIDALVEDHTPAPAVEQAVDRIDARIRRLETLARGGQEVDAAELEQLRAARDGHLEELEAVEALEARRLTAVARLLELGAAAGEVHRELAGDDGLTQPVDEVLSRVARDVAAARDTDRELDALDRARRARGAHTARR